MPANQTSKTVSMSGSTRSRQTHLPGAVMLTAALQMRHLDNDWCARAAWSISLVGQSLHVSRPRLLQKSSNARIPCGCQEAL